MCEHYYCLLFGTEISDRANRLLTTEAVMAVSQLSEVSSTGHQDIPIQHLITKMLN